MKRWNNEMAHWRRENGKRNRITTFSEKEKSGVRQSRGAKENARGIEIEKKRKKSSSDSLLRSIHTCTHQSEDKSLPMFTRSLTQSFAAISFLSWQFLNLPHCAKSSNKNYTNPFRRTKITIKLIEFVFAFRSNWKIIENWTITIGLQNWVNENLMRLTRKSNFARLVMMIVLILPWIHQHISAHCCVFAIWSSFFTSVFIWFCPILWNFSTENNWKHLAVRNR